jgi:hypothetical protein
MLSSVRRRGAVGLRQGTDVLSWILSINKAKSLRVMSHAYPAVSTQHFPFAGQSICAEGERRRKMQFLPLTCAQKLKDLCDAYFSLKSTQKLIPAIPRTAMHNHKFAHKQYTNVI